MKNKNKYTDDPKESEIQHNNTLTITNQTIYDGIGLDLADQPDFQFLSRTDINNHNKYLRLLYKIENRDAYFESLFLNSKKYLQPIEYKQVTERYLRWHASSSRMRQRLDKNIIIDNQSKLDVNYKSIYPHVAAWPKRLEHAEKVLGLNIEKEDTVLTLAPEIRGFVDDLASNIHTAQGILAGGLLKLALVEAERTGKYIVFSTLTVDPEHYEQVFKKGSYCFRNYLRNIKELLLQHEGTYFDYFAVIEKGGTTGRLHLHVLQILDSSCGLNDPNYGQKLADKREIKELNIHWKYGFSSHIPVRFTSNDVWGMMEWKWPVDGAGEAVKAGTVEKVAGYMSKYIMKSQRQEIGKGVFVWRIRKSRTLGTRHLSACISLMNNLNLLSLVCFRTYPIPIKLYGIEMPPRLIRRIALKELLKRKTNKTIQSQALQKTTALTMLLKNMIPMNRNRKLRNFGDLMAEVLQNPVIFDDLHEHFLRSKETLEELMPESSPVTAVNCERN